MTSTATTTTTTTSSTKATAAIKTSSRPRPPPLPSTISTPTHAPKAPFTFDIKTPISPPTAYAEFLKNAAALTPTTPTLHTPITSSSSSSSADALRSPTKSPRGYYLIHTPRSPMFPPLSAGGGARIKKEPRDETDEVPLSAGGVLRVRVVGEEKRAVSLMPAPKGKRRRVE